MIAIITGFVVCMISCCERPNKVSATQAATAVIPMNNMPLRIETKTETNNVLPTYSQVLNANP